MELEAESMVRRNAMLSNGLLVQLCAIALVLIPSIPWKCIVKLQHIVVAVSLGEHAGCCNGKIEGIAFNNTVVRNACIRLETIPVYEQALGPSF